MTKLERLNCVKPAGLEPVRNPRHFTDGSRRSKELCWLHLTAASPSSDDHRWTGGGYQENLVNSWLLCFSSEVFRDRRDRPPFVSRRRVCVSFVGRRVYGLFVDRRVCGLFVDRRVCVFSCRRRALCVAARPAMFFPVNVPSAFNASSRPRTVTAAVPAINDGRYTTSGTVSRVDAIAYSLIFIAYSFADRIAPCPWPRRRNACDDARRRRGCVSRATGHFRPLRISRLRRCRSSLQPPSRVMVTYAINYCYSFSRGAHSHPSYVDTVRVSISNDLRNYWCIAFSFVFIW